MTPSWCSKTLDPVVKTLRARPQRNFLATLLLSQGGSMLLGGDEKQGNNYTSCQDNELSWFDGEHVDETRLEFSQHLIQFPRDCPIFYRRWF